MGTHGSALPFFKQKPIFKKIAQIQTEWRQYATIVLENVRRNHDGQTKISTGCIKIKW